MLGLPYFEIVTDHQALVSMLNTKTLDEIGNARQQNMKEKIQQSFNFKVKRQAGRNMIINDALSRAPVEECMEVSEVGDFNGVTATEKLIVNVVTNDAEKVLGDLKLNSLLQKANTDQDYITLRDLVTRGFPPKRNMLPEKLKDYH